MNTDTSAMHEAGPPTTAGLSAPASEIPPARSHTRLFLRKLFRQGFSVAAMKPASKSLAAAHCKHVDATRPQVVVEIGAGTGAVTAAVAQRMHKDSLLIAVEIDQDFAAILRERCPRATVLACDASDLPQHLTSLNVDRIDLMISCIALPHVPRKVNESIFGCLKTMGDGAWFTQQTLVPLVYRRMYHRLFSEVHFRMVFANLPPGGVYHCRGLKADYQHHLPGKR